jgi:hypothetical protein
MRPLAVAVTLALVALGGCAAGSGGQFAQSHEDWLHSPSGPFPDNGNGGGGGGGRDAGTAGHR